MSGGRSTILLSFGKPMRVEEQEEVRKLPILAATQPEHLAEILRRSFLQRFPPHVELVREGEPPDFLHVVVDGQVEVFSRNGPRETTIAVLARNETFILAAVITDGPYLKSARALTAAKILMIPAELVRQTAATDAGFAHALTLELARAYRSVVKELKNQKLRSALERVAAWILRMDSQLGETGKFDLPYEKKVLAARIGVAPEVLSRCFGSLAAYEVRVSGKTVTIGSRDVLAKLAHPNPLIDDPEP